MLDFDRPPTNIGVSALPLPVTKDGVACNTAQHFDGANFHPIHQLGHRNLSWLIVADDRPEFGFRLSRIPPSGFHLQNAAKSRRYPATRFRTTTAKRKRAQTFPRTFSLNLTLVSPSNAGHSAKRSCEPSHLFIPRRHINLQQALTLCIPSRSVRRLVLPISTIPLLMFSPAAAFVAAIRHPRCLKPKSERSGMSAGASDAARLRPPAVIRHPTRGGHTRTGELFLAVHPTNSSSTHDRWVPLGVCVDHKVLDRPHEPLLIKCFPRLIPTHPHF